MRIRSIAIATAFLAASTATTLADRAPTAEELAELERALQAEGFQSWEQIEWDDDGHWEVDDAVDADGRSWDLRLDSSLQIIERDG